MRKQKTYWEIKNDMHNYFAYNVKECRVEKDYLVITCFDKQKALDTMRALKNAGLDMYRDNNVIVAWYN